MPKLEPLDMSKYEVVDPIDLRERLANVCRTGHHGIAETKVVNGLLDLFNQECEKRVAEADRMTLETISAILSGTGGINGVTHETGTAKTYTHIKLSVMNQHSHPKEEL